MSLIKDKKTRWLVAFLYAFSLFLGLPAALLIPENTIYDLDDSIIIESGSLLFFNMPPNILTWPGGPLLSSEFVVITLKFFFSHFKALINIFQFNFFHFLEELNRYIAEIILYPYEIYILLRVLVLLVSALGPALLFLLIYERGGFSLALFSSLIYVSMFYIVKLSVALKGGSDLWALTFCLAALVCLSKRKLFSLRHVVAGGILYGMAISSRLTYILFIPFYLLELSNGFGQPLKQSVIFRKISTFFIFFVFAFISFVIFVPFVWTAPVTFAKSFFGQVLLHSNLELNFWGFLTDYIVKIVPIPILLIASIGIVYSFRILHRNFAAVLLLTFSLYIFVMILNADNFSHLSCLLPFLLFCCIYAGAGLSFLSKILPKRLSQIITILFFTLIITINLYQVFSWYVYNHRKDSLSECREWLYKNLDDGTSIALPGGYDFRILPNLVCLNRLNRLYLEDELNKRRRFLNTIKKLRINDASGILEFSPILLYNFFENEKINLVISENLLWYMTRFGIQKKTFDIWLYDKVSTGIDIKTTEEVIDLFIKGHISFLVSLEKIPSLDTYYLRSFPSRKKGKDYYIYTNINQK